MIDIDELEDNRWKTLTTLDDWCIIYLFSVLVVSSSSMLVLTQNDSIMAHCDCDDATRHHCFLEGYARWDVS